MIVGTGPIETELRSRATDLGISDKVIFTGARRDVPRLLKAMDVFVLPSVHEGFGFALLEAMISSLPVVASQVGGIPEVVENGRTGLLVPPADPHALAEAIVRLLSDDTLRLTMGRAGYDQVMARFTAMNAAAETERLFEQLLRAKGIDVPPAYGGLSSDL